MRKYISATSKDTHTSNTTHNARQIRTTCHSRELQESIGSQKASQCEGYAQQQTPVWEDHTLLAQIEKLWRRRLCSSLEHIIEAKSN